MKRLLFILILLFFPYFASGADLLTGYSINDDSQSFIASDYFNSQSFKVSQSSYVTSIEIKCVLVGTAGNAIVGLYNADVNGCPSGAALATTSVDGNSCDGTMKMFTFAASTTLTANTSYSIKGSTDVVLDGGNCNKWRLDQTAPSYADGNRCYDSGSGWTQDLTSDMSFNVYGYTIEGGAGGAAGQMNFPEVLVVIIAVFVICFIIDRGGGLVINKVKNIYAWKI